MRRVVVTGLGAVTAIGTTVDTFWENIKKGTCGIKLIDKFDTTDYKAKVAATIDDFDPKEYMDAKTAKRMAEFCQYAVAATKQAIDNSGLDLEKQDMTRFGASIGSGIGALGVIYPHMSCTRRTHSCSSHQIRPQGPQTEALRPQTPQKITPMT